MSTRKTNDQVQKINTRKGREDKRPTKIVLKERNRKGPKTEAKKDQGQVDDPDLEGADPEGVGDLDPEGVGDLDPEGVEEVNSKRQPRDKHSGDATILLCDIICTM